MTQLGNANLLPHRKLLNRCSGFGDRSDNLMTRNKGQFGVSQLPIDDMQIGPANAAGMHLDQNLLWIWSWQGQLSQLQGLVGRLQDHGSHCSRPPEELLINKQDL
jgi:hypothetical protein